MRGLRQALQHRLATLCVFGVCSFAAVAIGAYICALSGVPSALWIRNLAAWCVGAVLAVEAREERAFAQRAEAIGLRYAVGDRIDGFNISQGRTVSVAVFRSEGTE